MPAAGRADFKRGVPAAQVTGAAGAQVLPADGALEGKPYLRVKDAAAV